jgi:hypothetical protein
MSELQLGLLTEHHVAAYLRADAWVLAHPHDEHTSLVDDVLSALEEALESLSMAVDQCEAEGIETGAWAR